MISWGALALNREPDSPPVTSSIPLAACMSSFSLSCGAMTAMYASRSRAALAAWGFAGDRKGHKVVPIAGSVALSLAALVATVGGYRSLFIVAAICAAAGAALMAAWVRDPRRAAQV